MITKDNCDGSHYEREAQDRIASENVKAQAKAAMTHTLHVRLFGRHEITEHPNLVEARRRLVEILSKNGLHREGGDIKAGSVYMGWFQIHEKDAGERVETNSPQPPSAEEVAAIERAEDLEYGTIPPSEQCGHHYPLWGRDCGRRIGHLSSDHRSGEISWTDAMARNRTSLYPPVKR